jgi:hypothetical protein
MVSTLGYQVHVVNGTYASSWYVKLHILVNSKTHSRHVPYVGETLTVAESGEVQARITGFSDNAGSTPYSSDDFHLGWLARTPSSIPTVQPQSEHALVVDALRLFGNRYLVDQFQHFVETNYRDIAASSCFSAVDAFSEATSSLGTDVLQTLYKVPNIAAAFPKIKEAVSVLGDIVHRDLSLSTLKEILDIATSTVLQANFTWRPYISLIRDYFPAMKSMFDALTVSKSVVIGRGSFRYNFSPEECYRHDTKLVTHTKMVMDASSPGLLSAILKFDVFGIAPKPSNLWDLLPFTFVVNWFTGVGQSIKRLEGSAELATIPAYYVHTYTLTSPFTERELDLLKMSSSGSVAAGLRAYYRDVSLYSPFPRATRFGFGIPSRLPPLGSLGSLLWQLFS